MDHYTGGKWLNCDTKHCKHDDVIKWKHFPRYWPFVREIHRSPVNFPHKGQWRGALIFALICVWINGWVNNREAGDLRRYRAHYDVIVMRKFNPWCQTSQEKNSRKVWTLQSIIKKSLNVKASTTDCIGVWQSPCPSIQNHTYICMQDPFMER